jgi:leucyl aminopeptidase
MPLTSSSNPLQNTPSLDPTRQATVQAASQVPSSATAVGYLVSTDGPVPSGLGLDRAALSAAGFSGAPGSTLVSAASGGPVRVAVGTGAAATLDDASLRDAAGAFGRAAASHENLAISLDGTASVAADRAAKALAEGALLARYRYDVLRSSSSARELRELTVVSADPSAAWGARVGQTLASATMLSRDLANTPHNHLTASNMADIAVALGAQRGFDVEVFDEKQMLEMGIGGILGVNAGSAEPPRLIRLTYAPADATGRLAMVGKGIMYDSGGIALKPGDAVHAAMKNDMSGAAAILAAVATMAAVGSRTAVTGYLMCTDNMPSGTAMALGDVITIRGGTTVEVVNTDAEGRLVMADGLVLAVEEQHDAIIDIATLTGACMRALGTEVAGVFGNNRALVEQVRAAGDATDEPVWELPLYRGYRRQLDSPIADLKNLGYGEGGAITAALFLEEFVAGVPWAHVDMAGVAVSTDGRPWHTAGCTGFGARLLVELAANFRAAEVAQRAN